MDPELARRQALWAGMAKSDFGYADTDYVTTDDLKDQGRQYAQVDWEAKQKVKSGHLTVDEYKAAKQTNKSNPLEWALGMRDRGNNGGVLETVGQLLSVGQQISSAVTEARVEGMKQDTGIESANIHGYWDAFKDQTTGMMGTVLKTALATPTGGLVRPDISFSPDAYIDAWTNQHDYVHLAQKYGVYNNNPMGINEDLANFAGGFAADVALDPVSALTLGTTQWMKVGITANVAEKAGLLSKAGTPLAELTHTRWGNTIWRLAAQKMAPELVDHAITPQKFGEIADYAVTHFDELKKLHLDRVLKGNIWSKVKIGLAPAGETAFAGLERLTQGKVQVLSKMGLKDMFQETSSMLTREHGLYSTNKAQKFLASLPVVSKPMKWVFDTFDRGWQAPPEVNEAINLMKNKVEGQFKRQQLQHWAEFKRLGLSSIEDRELVSTAIEKRFAGSPHQYAPHIEAGMDYYRQQMDRILSEANEAGFQIGTVLDYVGRETNPMVRRSMETMVSNNGEELLKGGAATNKYTQQRMIASIADGEDIFGEGVFVKDSMEVLLKRERAHINMIEKDKLFRFIEKNHGTPWAIVNEQFNGMSKGLLAGWMRRMAHGPHQVLNIDQVYANKSGALNKLGFKEGDLEHNRKLLAYLARDNMDKLGVEGRAHGAEIGANEAAKMHYVFNDGKPATPVPKEFSFNHKPLKGFDLGAGGRRNELPEARTFSVDTFMQMVADPSHQAWRSVFKADVAGTRADLTNVSSMLKGMDDFAKAHLDSPLVGFIPDIEKRVMDAWENALAGDRHLVRGKGLHPDIGPLEATVDAARQKKLDSMRKAVQKTIASMGGNFEVIGAEPTIPETLVALATASRRMMGNITDTSVPHAHDLRYLEELYAKLGFTPEVKAQLEHITLGDTKGIQYQAHVDRLIETLDRFAYEAPMLRDGKIVETSDRQIGKVTGRLGPDVRRTRQYRYDSRFQDDLVEFTFNLTRKLSGNVMPEVNDLERANVAFDGKLRPGSKVEQELTAERMRKIAAGEVPEQKMGLHDRSHDVLPARGGPTGFQGKNTPVELAHLLADRDALAEAVSHIKFGKKAKSENGQVLADILLEAGIEKNTASKAKQDYFDKAKASALGKEYETLVRSGDHDGAVRYLQEHMKTQASKDAVSALEVYNESMKRHSKWIETYTEADVLEQLHEKGLLPDFPTGEKPKDLLASINPPLSRPTGVWNEVGRQMERGEEVNASHLLEIAQYEAVDSRRVDVRELARHLRQNYGDFLNKVTVKRDVNLLKDVGHVAHYNPEGNFINLSPHANEETALHEVLHALTFHAINGDITGELKMSERGHAARDNLIQLFRSAKQSYLSDFPHLGVTERAEKMRSEHYGLTDLHEFISEAFSNPKFQTFLRETKVSRSPHGSLETLWDSFVEYVGDLIGFGKKDMLGHVIANANDLIKERVKLGGVKTTTGEVLASTRVPGEVSSNPSLDELHTAIKDMTEHRRVLNENYKAQADRWTMEDHYQKVATEATNKRDAAEKVKEARQLHFEAIKGAVDKLANPTKEELATVKLARKALKEANADLKPLVSNEVKLKEAAAKIRDHALPSREELTKLQADVTKKHGELLEQMRVMRRKAASADGISGGGAEFGKSADAPTKADQLRMVREQIKKASGTQLEDLNHKKDALVREITGGPVGNPPYSAPPQEGLNFHSPTIEHKVYLPRGIAEVLHDVSAPELPEGMSDAVLGMIHKWDKLTGLYKSNSLLPNAGYWGREFVGNAALMGLRTGTAFLDPTNKFEKMRNMMGATIYALTKYSNYAADVGHSPSAARAAAEKWGEMMIHSKTGRSEKLSDLIESMMDRGIFHGQMSADLFDAMPSPTKYHRVIGAVNGAVAGAVAGSNGGAILDRNNPDGSPMANYGALMGAVVGGLAGAAGDKMRLGGIPVPGMHGAAGLLQSNWKPFIRAGEAFTNMPFRVGVFMNEFMEHGSSYHAANEVYRHMNDLNSLSVTERRVLRRIFPYYSWMKNSLRHTGYQLIENPDRLATVYKSFRDWNDSQHVDPEDIPDNLSNNLAMVFKGAVKESATRDFNGEVVPARSVNAVASGLRLPEEDVASMISGLFPGGTVATDSKEFLKQVASRTNFPAAALAQYADNKDWYSGKEIVSDSASDQNPKDWRGAPGWLQSLVGYSPAVKGEKNESVVNPKLAWAMGKTPWSSLINMSKAIYDMPDQQKKGLDYWSMAHKLLGANVYKQDPMTGKFFINKGRIDALSNLLQRIGDIDSGSAP